MSFKLLYTTMRGEKIDLGITNLECGSLKDGGIVESETITQMINLAGEVTYTIPGHPESGKTTLHLQEGEYATDVYEQEEYKVGDKLYASENSKLTNIPHYNQVGIVTKSPGAVNPFLTFYLKNQKEMDK